MASAMTLSDFFLFFFTFSDILLSKLDLVFESHVDLDLD